ncbi:MAG: mannose-1-phosphate guanylyltransferase/mannose-6-phosphate isomerase [Actinobacteria bacterium]|nr:mannose-1-phosphate guanylyltransferase/mannose-6-phosphate isomerase [Actinomycetota bacterium]
MTIQPVILAGGSGTRLWPASRRGHPKQLLALVGPRTLLQDTAARARDFGGPAPARQVADPLVVTNEEYRFMVADQLRKIGITEPRIILEPAGRNTAPALTLAALLTGRAPRVPHDSLGPPPPGPDGDPILLVMPSDHLIADVPAFHAALAEGAAQAEAGLLVTFGIVPDRPETGYGYIRAGGPAPGRVLHGPSEAALRSGGATPTPGGSTARLLAGFAEKPDAATARRYVKSGEYLWNGGIFMMKRSVWLAAMERYRPDILKACAAAVAGARTDGLFVRLDKNSFLACPSGSIDYAVMERLSQGEAAVVPLDAGWSDIGAWGALWTVCSKDGAGNVVRGDVILEDTRDTLVQADSRLVAVLGADDLVVIETADAVLVAPKDKTHDLKKLVASVRLHNEDLTLTHRRVQRPWGCFDSIDSGRHFQVKRIVVSPGASLSLQLHRHRAEHWVVVNGVAEITCGDTVMRLRQNESTFVPVNTPHRLANPGAEPLEIIEVQSGDYLGEDDIVRLEDDYGRTEPGEL